jgi:hypothetical protein
VGGGVWSPYHHQHPLKNGGERRKRRELEKEEAVATPSSVPDFAVVVI